MSPIPQETATEEFETESQFPEATQEPEPFETDGSDTGQSDMDDALAERDQFIEDQQLPLDGSQLSAVTPEQQQFIEEQRAHVESQGGVWTPEAESLTLALTSDACETAILNHHETDVGTVEMHIASSPLFQSQVSESLSEEEQAQIEFGMADIMVYGMQHMCPEDFEQWTDAVMELYPEYYEAR